MNNYGTPEVFAENRYEVLENLQEPTETIGGLDLRKIRGVTNVSRRNLTKKDHKVILKGDSHARDCAGKKVQSTTVLLKM